MVESTRSARKGEDSARSHLKIVVPDDHSMVALLGSRDELLHIIERAFHSDIHVRGNEITITGREPEAEKVGRLFEELLILLEKGHDLTPASVGQTIDIIKKSEAKRS